jgi:hypothetical protein
MALLLNERNRNMERFWNIIHFFAYKFLTKMYMSSLKVAVWYFNTALVKKIFEKNGRNAEMAMKDLKFAFTDKRAGQSSFYAYGIMIAIPFVFLFVSHNLILNALDLWVTVDNKLSFFPIIFYAILSGLLNYRLLLRHDKYIKYFKKFEKQPRKWKVKWAWISSIFIAFPFIVFISIFIM